VTYASTNPILDRLVRAGILLRLRRDRYVLAEQAVAETRKIANELVKPSAISLWTALSDAGLTTQVPRVVQSVTPKRSVQTDTLTMKGLPSFQYVHLSEALFFGMQIDSAGIFRMPPEKAFLDLLFVQRGTVDRDSIDISRLDRSLLLRFADRFPPHVRRALLPFPQQP
jgi:predicted transcriptional regulator